MATHYLEAVRTLVEAENQAWQTRNFETLARLYLPLQEARRQIRQRCGEGAVQLHLIAKNELDSLDAGTIASRFPIGQLLVAGWSSIEPALQIRKLAETQQLYLETFLAAVYVMLDARPIIAIVPIADMPMPEPSMRSIEELQAALPPCSLLIAPDQLPTDAEKGTAATYAGVMALWERLHTPFLNAAEQESDPLKKMQAYRQTLRVDPACELAHQFLAEVAREQSRRR